MLGISKDKDKINAKERMERGLSYANHGFLELFLTWTFACGKAEVADNLFLEEYPVHKILLCLKLTDTETFMRGTADYFEWKEGKSPGRSFLKIEINILAGKLL